MSHHHKASPNNDTDDDDNTPTTESAATSSLDPTARPFGPVTTTAASSANYNIKRVVSPELVNVTSQVATLGIKESLESMGQSLAFAQFMGGWEAYLGGNEVLQQPLLQFCKPNRLMPAVPEYGHPLAPQSFRHTHSSPLQSRTSLYDPAFSNDVPPPVPLDPFQRSSSTPSSFRQSSASFGVAESSAFSMPRSSYTATNENTLRYSAFDPIKYYARQLEDMERTAIEVVDMGPSSIENNNLTVSEEEEKPKKPAASRAARFLSDVKLLRRRRRVRGGRENPAQLPIVDAEADAQKDGETSAYNSGSIQDIAVTVVTEMDSNSNNATESSMISQSSELSAIINSAEKRRKGKESELDSSPAKSLESTEECAAEDNTSYQQLDTENDNDDDKDRISPTFEANFHDSPNTVPSPTYQEINDEQLNEDTATAAAATEVATAQTRDAFQPLQVKLARKSKNLSTTFAVDTTSPTPSQMLRGEAIISQASQDSPTASPGTRSAQTGTSSGHTTHATSISSSTGQGLSTISETDREVMEANKQGKQRRSLQQDPCSHMNKVSSDTTSVHSSSTDSNNPVGYLALGGSPVPLREGAVVETERFFTESPNVNDENAVDARRTLSMALSKKSGRTQSSSPVTLGSNSLSNTSSSASSGGDKPLNFVSYFDRQHASELTSVREVSELSSKRASGEYNREERDGSPAELAEYNSVAFEEASDVQRLMRVNPLRYYHGRLNKARPPLSPVKGMRPPSSTPPPRCTGSPLYHLSPPRNIVDRPIANLTRPYVVRGSVSMKNFIPPDAEYIVPSALEPLYEAGYEPYHKRTSSPIGSYSSDDDDEDDEDDYAGALNPLGSDDEDNADIVHEESIEIVSSDSTEIVTHVVSP